MIRTISNTLSAILFRTACVLIFCFCLASSVLAADSATSDGAGMQGISLKDVNNFTYHCPNAGELPDFVFKNGTFKRESTSAEDPNNLTMANIINAAFGKLLPGEQQEAAVVFVYNGGGSGWFYELTVLTRRNGKLTQLGCTPLGDRVQVNAMEIKNNQIVLDMTTHGPDDPACCPTVRCTARYVLDNDQLMEKQ